MAMARSSSASIPIATYHYLNVTNILPIKQTVTLSFKSAGVTLKAGGFHKNITGWTTPGGPTASDGVTCSANVCSLKAVIAKGKSVRLGVRINRDPVLDFKISEPLVSNGSEVGLIAEVYVEEDQGRVVASAMTWLDIDVTPAFFIDSATSYVLNGGRPF
jgi:hypothetical protein